MMLFARALIASLMQVSRIGALQLGDAVLDAGSFSSWDTPPLTVAAGEAYRRELAAASAANTQYSGHANTSLIAS